MASFGSLSSTTTISPVSSDQSSVEDAKTGVGSLGPLHRGTGPTSYVLPSYSQYDTHNRNILKDREPNFFTMDHSYSKPCILNPSASKTMPTRTLMFNYPIRQCDSPNDLDEMLDVETSPPPTIASYDALKSRITMGECERYVESTLPIAGEDDSGRTNDEDDWEERVSKTNWTFPQVRLFGRATRILHTDRLARLTHEGASNEPIMRRIAVDKSAKRFRQLLGSINWAANLTQWLHTVFMDHLSAPYLAAYLEILQALKSKVPALVDTMMAIPPPSKSISSCGSGSSLNDSLAQLLKKPWDPTSVTYTPKPKKLPGSAMIVVAPFGPSPSVFNQLRRMRLWSSQFASLGKMIPVTMHSTGGGRNQRISECLEHMMTATRNKVSELRTSFPSRPVVLIGWSVAALVACHVALTERVAAVVCLGFPSSGVGGVRGEVDDPLLDLKTPTLFVIGEMSTLSNIDDVEDMREKMKTETSLLVVGGADELLRVFHKKKRMEGVTQSMVDRYIMEELNKFLTNVLSRFVPESPGGVARGMAATSCVKRDSSSSLAKEAQKRRKRKSTSVGDDEPPDVKTIRNQWKSPAEIRKEVQQTNVTSNPDVCGIQQSPIPASLNSPPLESPPLDIDLKVMGRRNYGSVRVAPSPKKTKFNPIVNPVESSSTTSESSNNSLPGETAATGCSSAVSKVEDFDKATEDFSSPLVNTKLQSSPPSTSGGITVSIGALSSLGHLRACVTPASPAMTSLVNKTSPPKTSVPTTSDVGLIPTPTIAILPSAQRSPPAFGRSLPITIQGATVRSAFSVARTSAQASISSLMTYALSSKGNCSGASTSTTPSTSASTSTSLLLTNKVGAFETIRQAGRLIVCKSSDVTNREKFLDQVQAIQKMQFHDFPLTTASLTRAPGSPIITQAKILASRGFDLKKLQTLSTSIAGQLRAGSSASAATTSTSTTTSPMPSLLIATGGGVGKPIFVSGSAVSLAKMCQSVGAEAASGGDTITNATAQSVLEQARRANPLLNFTVSSVKLHIPERKSSPSKGSGSPKVSLIMLSSNSSSKVQRIEKPKEEISEQQRTLDANEGAALLLDLARSAPAAASWQQQQHQPQPIEQQSSMLMDIPAADDVAIEPPPTASAPALENASSKVLADESTDSIATDSDCVIIDDSPIKSPPPLEEVIVDQTQIKPMSDEVQVTEAETSEPESLVAKEAKEVQPEKSDSKDVSIKVAEAPPPPSSSKGSSSRSKPPPFPTIAATRTRRIRAPKYMYYEV